MTLRPSGRAALKAALAALLLHTVIVLVVWRTWGEFGRGNVLTWIDFPASLLYLELDDTPMLLWSLGAGGVQWVVIAWLLTMSLGWATRARPR